MIRVNQMCGHSESRFLKFSSDEHPSNKRMENSSPPRKISSSIGNELCVLSSCNIHETHRSLVTRQVGRKLEDVSRNGEDVAENDRSKR